MTPLEKALLGSACVIGWTLVPGEVRAEGGVVLTRRIAGRVDVLSYTSFTGTAVVIGQQLDGDQLWRHEVPVKAALYWATGEYDDDAPLAAAAAARAAVRDPDQP